MAENGEANSDAFVYDPDKNYDEATLAFQRQIEKEVADQQSLVGGVTTLDKVEIDYSEGDPAYKVKIQDLKSRYRCIRKTRGDGNCFYRAFGYAYLEKLLHNNKDLPRFKNVVEKSKDDLVSLGFPQFTIEDFHDTFMDVINKVENNCTQPDLIEVFNDQGLSDYVVVYLRLLVSGYLQKESEFYSNFIDGCRTVKEFCNQEVEPMGKESDHIHITALTSALGVNIRVEYMDRVGDKCHQHDFPEGSIPAITLLYKPGHYDIMYSTDDSNG